MEHKSIFVNGNWQPANFPVSSFKPINPTSGKQIQESFPISSFLDLEDMIHRAIESEQEITNISPDIRSDFLLLCAKKFNDNKKELIDLAHSETALTKDSSLSNIEFSRMIKNLETASEVCKERSWQRAIIDKKNGLKSIRRPLNGPIVIFGPANQPFSANSCCGKNFAAAIASGNSIIAKGNPNHPQTSYKLAILVSEAIAEIKLPAAIFQFFHETTKDLGYRLASHPQIGALAFTGSKSNGFSLKESADRAGNLLFMETSPFSPVFLLPEKLEKSCDNIADKLTKAVLSHNGQDCSKPSAIFMLKGRNSDKLLNTLKSNFERKPVSKLFSDISARNNDGCLANLLRLGATQLTVTSYNPAFPFDFPNTIVTMTGKNFQKFALQIMDDSLGPILIAVLLDKEEEFMGIAKTIKGIFATNLPPAFCMRCTTAFWALIHIFLAPITVTTGVSRKIDKKGASCKSAEVGRDGERNQG